MQKMWKGDFLLQFTPCEAEQPLQGMELQGKWLYGRFTEIKSNFRRKKLHRTNQGSNFLGGSFSNRDNVTTPIQFRRESQLHHLKR